MRKLALGLVALAGAVAAPASVAGAAPHPWCMVIQTLDDGWACAFDTFQQCLAEARAGNTGFCAANPFYRAPAPPVRKPKRRRAHPR